MAMEPHIPSTEKQPKRLPVVGATPATARNASTDAETQGVVDVEAELRAYEQLERERIGLRRERRQWADTMLAPEVKRSEREKITLLISGLTAAQDFLVEGALRGQGYNVQWIGTSDNAGLQAGKEFGNRGQCNPTYFTVGSLVKHLIDLRDKEGMSAEDIVKNYVFFTAGACGPCRFGMYVTEYRKALRDAGFEGFRVMLFQQQGGLSQATGNDAGIDLSPPFFIAIVKALVCGDVLNALGYRIRPYEVEPGATNKAVENAKKILYKALLEKRNVFYALWQCRKEFAAVKVDKLRSRAKVSIIGEFWAMTTEGDGNYQLQKFLESEGGENDVQLITAWLLYNIWEVDRDTRERAHLRGADEHKRGLAGMGEFDVFKRLATLRLAEWGLRLGFQAFALPIGLNDYHLPDMNLVAEVAQDYYNNDLRGGEGHMEVGKLIVNTVMSKCHITVSVKPFGCMPSSGVSDGVQSLITSRYPGTIFCPVETSGDGATNFYSRIQMYMFKARLLAEAELKRVMEECGVTEEQVRDFLAKNPEYNSALHKPPHKVAGTAADLVYEIAPQITMTQAQRAQAKATSMMKSARAVLTAVPGLAKKVVTKVAEPEFREQVKADAELVRDIISGKVKERYAPLVERLAYRAMWEKDPMSKGGAVAHDHSHDRAEVHAQA